MSLSRRIFYNTVAQSLGKAVAIAIGLITLGLLTRFLHEEGFGQYSIVLAFMGFVAALADLGLYMVVVRGISQQEEDHKTLISNVLGLRFTTALIALLGGAITALLFPYEPIVQYTMFIGVLAFLFVPLNQALIGIFQKHLATHLPTFSELAGRLVNLGLVYWFVTTHATLPFFIVALACSNALVFALNFIFAKRFEEFSFSFDWSVWKKILITTWPLAFSVILNLTYFKGDTIILSLFHNADIVGIYSLPYKILEVLLAFPGMFVGLIMPLLSRYAFLEWDKFHSVLQKSFDALLLIIIPMVTTTIFFASPIINLIKGSASYQDSPQILQLLIFAAATTFIGTLFGYAVVAVKKERRMVWGYASGAVIGLLLYLLLIPSFSYIGAAVGTIATEVVVAVIAFILVRKASGTSLSLKSLVRALPATFILITLFYFVSTYWILEIILGLATYTLLLFITKAIPLTFVQEILFTKK